MKVCPNCGRALPDNVNFCRFCGQKIPNEPKQGQICPNCGTRNKLGAKFCTRCGTLLGASTGRTGNSGAPRAPQPQPNPVLPTPSPKTKKSFPVWAIIIIVVAAGIAAGFGGLKAADVISQRKQTTQQEASSTSEKKSSKKSSKKADSSSSFSDSDSSSSDSTSSKSLVVTGGVPDSSQENQNQTNPDGISEDQSDSSGDFVIPDSSTRYLTTSDLSGLSKDQLRYAINEMYARHGYIFKNQDLQNYFSQKNWYTPESNDQTEVYNSFSSVEKANQKLMTQYKADMGWTW